MLAKLHTFSLVGIEAVPVEVEVDVSPGALPKTILVGLAEAAVKESTHRVERALVKSGYTRHVDRAGVADGQRTVAVRSLLTIRGRRRTGARGNAAARQRRIVDGAGRQRAG